jgi:hypothetical protein
MLFSFVHNSSLAQAIGCSTNSFVIELGYAKAKIK